MSPLERRILKHLPRSNASLARQLKRDPGNTLRYLQRMADRGWVYQRPDKVWVRIAKKELEVEETDIDTNDLLDDYRAFKKEVSDEVFEEQLPNLLEQLTSLKLKFHTPEEFYLDENMRLLANIWMRLNDLYLGEENKTPIEGKVS